METAPKKILVDNKSITETKSIAENFNKYFTQTSPNLAKDIATSIKSFNEYIMKHGTTQQEKVIFVYEFKDIFLSLKINKSAGCADTHFNVVKKCFGVLHKPLLHAYLIFLYKLVFFQINSILLGLYHSLKVVKTMN